MPEDALGQVLKKRRQISITVIGRRTGRFITRPVWFVFEGSALWLLPVTGSNTQWYRNLKVNRAIGIRVGNERHNLRARLCQDQRVVRKVIQSFREKYTAPEIKRWYTDLDVAVQVSFRIRRT